MVNAKKPTTSFQEAKLSKTKDGRTVTVQRYASVTGTIKQAYAALQEQVPGLPEPEAFDLSSSNNDETFSVQIEAPDGSYAVAKIRPTPNGLIWRPVLIVVSQPVLTEDAS
jgi:hypothetical protein